jgi:hypothetical protein
VHWDQERLFLLMEEKLRDLVGTPRPPVPRDRDAMAEPVEERLQA